jgi:hypothetical protein
LTNNPSVSLKVPLMPAYVPPDNDVDVAQLVGSLAAPVSATVHSVVEPEAKVTEPTAAAGRPR